MRSMKMNMGTTKAIRVASGNLAARRGSTLILVVATLALLAVLTVAYVSIGGGDRRSARTTVRAAEVERQAQHIGDYLIGIVGDDALSIYFEGYDPSGEPIFKTEAVDLPRTDFNRTFDGEPFPGTPEPQLAYYGRAFTPIGSLPPLRTTDNPSAAASTIFNDLRPFGPSDPFLAASEPTYIREAGGPVNTPAYVDRVDWAKISNISPNGLFVNLFNLRDNFDAEPGLGADASGNDRMSENLSLTDRNGVPTTNLVYGGPAEPEIPAHFDSLLVGSFRPVDFDNGFTVDDERYMPYMWADADGDGFFDARWQELVDVVVPGSPGTFLPRNVVPSEGQLRWFVATRIVDLSGKVNVNTARSILQPPASGGSYEGAPTNGFRLGASPADIDLRRLLTLENSWAMFDEFYDAAPQPTGGAQDYSDYDNYDDARDIANQGYWALSRVLSGEQPPAGPLTPGIPPQLADERRDEYSLLRRGVDTPLRTDVDGVYRQYAFGLEDLSDLLAFNGLNNPQSLSSLERAVGGRLATLPFEYFSPLRENRALQWERDLTDPDAALALRHIGVRQHLTTLSGGIPRVPALVRYPSASPSALDVYTSSSSLPESTVALDPRDENPTVLQDGYRLLNLAAPSDLPESNPTLEVEERLKRNAHPMFRTYGNALMPAAAEPGAWTPPPPSSPPNPWQSTFYGFDRLFALRTAAHTTANMIDMFDGDDIPSAFTVLVDSANRSAMSGFTEFPWWNQPEPTSSNPGVSGRLDMGDERLPSGADAGGVIAMNVYGLEVHPFITQVSLYNIFTDASEDEGGDAEYVPSTGPGGGPIFGPGGGGSSNPVTINFDVNPAPNGNADFVGQVFAVQLTNPYTTAIEVRDDQYFIRFGELGGDTAMPALVDGLEVPAGTRIEAGQSIVVYAQTNEMPMRASAVAEPFVSLAEPQVESWLSLHMTGDPNGDPIEFETDMMGVGDFLASVPGDFSVDSDPNREVTLWTRLNRDPGLGPDAFTDVMLDRLYDPGAISERPTLDRRPPAVNTDVAGTTTGPEDMTVADALDNTGFSLVTWGTIARPTGAAAAPYGAIPAYVLEKPFENLGTSLNTAATDDFPLPTPLSPGFSLNRGQFVGGGKQESAERFLADIFSDTDGSSGMMAQIPIDIALQASDTTHQHRQQISTNEATPPVQISELYANPLRNDNRGLLDASGGAVRMLRPGDFLGVPAVGPVQMPAGDGGVVDPRILDWFTTGELLTLALGFDEAPPVHPSDLYYPSLPVSTYELLDRGHLSLDLPAPYVDRDTTGDFTTGDDRRGLGVPHAMAVMSSITTIDAPVNTRTPIAGLVNLNTATEATTSVLPGLTPTYESTIDPALIWINDGTNDLHDHRSDVAAGIRAYRDKSGALTRDGSTVDFLDPGARGDMDPQDLFGRQTITGLDGLREHSGLLSVGEMLAADTLPTGGPVLGPATYARPHMIRRLGQDGESLDLEGVDALRYSASGLVDQAAGSRDDGIADDYDEQLALFNGVANTVTVRSDVYAIWFVMHGYAPEDVEGLRPEDPMVPSIARRYLIVVDRSNVRRAGDKPRVLLFDELPL